jgi:hypothetical protein
MLTAIAVDPGGTTGWAMVQIDPHVERIVIKGEARTRTLYNEHWICGELGPRHHHSELYAHLERWHTSEFVLIGERFDFRGDDRSDINLMAREYIGVMNLFGQERGVDVVWQWPFEVVGDKPNTFVKDSNVKTAKLWVPGKRHAMDAMRHLLYWMTAKPRTEIAKQYRVELLKRMGK